MQLSPLGSLFKLIPSGNHGQERLWSPGSGIPFLGRVAVAQSHMKAFAHRGEMTVILPRGARDGSSMAKRPAIKAHIPFRAGETSSLIPGKAPQYFTASGLGLWPQSSLPAGRVPWGQTGGGLKKPMLLDPASRCTLALTARTWFRRHRRRERLSRDAASVRPAEPWR